MLTILSLYYLGKQIEKNKSWIYYLPGILCYTLNEGLRWGRGLDYNYYKPRFDKLLEGYESSWEPTFQLVVKLFGLLQLNFQCFLIFTSLLLIIALIMMSKINRNIAKYFLPCFYVFSISYVECHIRWYFALTFLFAAIYVVFSQMKNKLCLCIGLSIITVLLHNGLIVIPLILYGIYLCRNVICKPPVAISIFLILGFFFDSSFFAQYAGILKAFDFGTTFSIYSENAVYWLTSGFGGDEKSAMPQMYLSLLYIMMCYVGYKYLKKNNRVNIFFYNIFIIAFITMPLCNQVELLNRYNTIFLVLGSYVLAMIIDTYKNNPKAFSLPIRCFFLLALLNYSRVVITIPFIDDKNHYLYVWDSKGRDYLDVHIYWLKN